MSPYQKLLRIKTANDYSELIGRLAAQHPDAYKYLGDAGMYGLLSKYDQQSHLSDAIAASALKSGGLGALTGYGIGNVIQATRPKAGPGLVPLAIMTGLMGSAGGSALKNTIQYNLGKLIGG